MNETTDKTSVATINVACNEPQLPALYGTEEWRPVVGFETAYEVSSTGQVRTLDPKQDLRIMRQTVSYGKSNFHFFAMSRELWA